MNIVQNWRPRHVWLFAGLGVLSAFSLGTVVFALALVFPSIVSFLRVPAISSTLFVFNLGVFCGISVVVAKIKSYSQFKSAFDLSKPQEAEILAAATIGFVLQFAGIILFSGGLSNLHAAHSFDIKKLPALFSPFLEEAALRGFAYKAFRNSYGVAASVAFVVIISLIFHTQVYGSFYRLVMIITLNVVLCLIKERRPNLWNCIACHLAFNVIFVGLDQR